MTGWGRIGFALLLLLATVSSAQAQTQTATLAAGLEAQYRAALVRERRLADERELALIAEAEARMREASRALGIARRDRTAAERAIELARAEYVRLVNDVPLREATLRVEVEAFRAEIEGQLPQATPAVLAAYREFADGDRAAAWTTLEALLHARAAARTTAARAAAAAEVRQLGGLREVMRVNGEAGATDVLAIWNQAADLDATDFWTHYHRSRLALLVGDVDVADAAAQAALGSARDARETSIALNKIGEVRQARGDAVGAVAAYRESLGLRRGRAPQADNPEAPWRGAGRTILQRPPGSALEV
jgi:hypothetical protein